MNAASLALELNLFCVAELLYILYRLLKRNDRQLTQLKFRDMVIWHILALSVNAVSPFISAKLRNSPSLGTMNFVLYTVYYSLLNMAIRSWAIFFVYSADLEARVQKRFMWYMNISTTVLIFLNLTSQYTHIFYYVEDHTMKVTGAMQMQTNYLFLCQFVTVVLILRRTHSRMSHLMRKRLLLIASYPVIPFFFMALRVFLGKLPYLAVSNTMAIIIIYIGYLDQLISVDPLTGINNRDHMTEYIQHKMDEHPDNLCILMFDINRFKNINDTYGHVEGDQALKIITKALRNAFTGPYRSSFLSRYGGDEFIAVMDLKKEQLDDLLARVRSEVQKQCEENHLPYSLTLSAGCAWYSREMHTVDDFIKVADKCLYENKALMHKLMG